MFRLLMLLLLPLFVWGQSENIWVKVGKIYGIEPRLLYSIAKVESDLDRYVVAFSADRMTPKQAEELQEFLKRKGIESKMHTKVIAIKAKTSTKLAMWCIFYIQTNIRDLTWELCR